MKSVNEELLDIQEYINKENQRIGNEYNDDDTKTYLKGMLAYNVGLMVLQMNDHQSLSIRTLDELFSQFNTTFEEVKAAIHLDLYPTLI